MALRNRDYISLAQAKCEGRYTAATDAVDMYLLLVSGQGVVGAFYAIEWHHWQFNVV